MVGKASGYRIRRWLFPVTAVGLAMFTMTTCFAALAGGQEEEQKMFSSAREAVYAMVSAVQNGNIDELLAILGPESRDLVFSGDEVADRNGRERFLGAFGEKNRLDQVTADRMILIVGSKDYPFAIPIVRRGGSWLFDTPAGKEEILNRRIGRNELHTIDVLQAYTDAQREFACMSGNSGSEFARKFSSSKGAKDGLYWETVEDEEQSPFGPLIARAVEEGYTGGFDEDPPEPFHGYYFKILTAQGTNADGGAFDYVVDGRMVLGFALAAYPASYGASGIMTFMVNQEGVIYEKNLGEDTGRTASAMSTFDPDDTWNMYKEEVPEE